MERDDIYLIDMWRILLREWRWFLASLILVLLLAMVFARTAKPQWQATAWIQIGQIGTAPVGQDPKAEPLLRVIERLQLEPFQNEVLQSIGIGALTPEGRLYRKGMKLEPMPYAGPLVKLSVRAYSPQQAEQLASATASRLQAVHREIETVPLKLAHARLDDVQAALQQTLAERDRLRQSAAQNKDSISAALLLSRDEEIRNLQLTRDELQTRLNPPFTYDTSLMWPVYVLDHPVFPNPALIWGVGLLFGLFLGAFAAIARNALRRGAVVRG